MPGLVNRHGQPISSNDFQNKKATPPKLGEAYGNWAGREDQGWLTLPGGGIVQFDLSKLTLADFRAMKDHYQVNSSLAVLSFMQHQSDWHIESSDKKVAQFCEDNLREIWTQLNRAMGQANWCGYAPNILQWENDLLTDSIQLTKVKDLIPEECQVHWKLVPGYAPPGHPPPKYKVYDGIKQFGAPYPVPVENSFWYPLLMENGDYYGKKLLRPAFTSWFFSILVHLFANRYYERFGEPTPVGRAPFDEEITTPDGRTMSSNTYMLEILQQLRNRAVVVLPNDSTQMESGKSQWDYDLQYLESQMRGADFERYMTRLDEEISIGLFTPILLLRTADVGSYNLGVGHMQMYLWMLNAMNDDRATYINKYILRRMVDFKFGVRAPNAKIVFRKLGTNNAEMLKDLLLEMMRQGRLGVDLEELGQMTGMSLREIQVTVEGDGSSGNGSEADGTGSATGRRRGESATLSGDRGVNAHAIAKEIVDRVEPQVVNAIRNGKWGPDLKVNMGYKKRMNEVLGSSAADQIYGFMDSWTEDMLIAKVEPAEFMSDFKGTLESRVQAALDAS